MKGVGGGSPLIESYMKMGEELTNGLKGEGHLFSFMLKQKNPPNPTQIMTLPGSLGISLYLELLCFLSFVSFVLRNLCSGTYRRNISVNLSLFNLNQSVQRWKSRSTKQTFQQISHLA